MKPFLKFLFQVIDRRAAVLFLLTLFFNLDCYTQSKRLKRLYSDSNMFVTRFDSTYLKLHMQYGSITTTTTYNKIYPGNNARNEYNKPGGTSRAEFISFAGTKKYLPIGTPLALQYFETVPDAKRKYRRYMFWKKANKNALFITGGAIVLFFTTLPFPEPDLSNKNHLLHYRILQGRYFFGITALSSLFSMYFSYSLAPRPLKKAVKLYNEGVDKRK